MTTNARTPSLQARLQDRCFAEELRRNAEGYWTDRRCTRDAQHQGGHEFGPWHPLRGGDFPLDGSHAEIAQQLIAKWRGDDAADAMVRGYAETAFTLQTCANELEIALRGEAQS